jgi:hypothetical protein
MVPMMFEPFLNLFFDATAQAIIISGLNCLGEQIFTYLLHHLHLKSTNQN